MTYPTTQINKYVVLWLVLCLVMILGMVLIGGYTRLTGSGLSLTEWKPVTGIFPPLNLDQWVEEFQKYKTSPEFKKINHYYNLDDFKQIYYIEYLHRLLARITGFVFLVPFLFFIIKGNLSKKVLHSYMLIFFIGVIQGICGWYMVKSGLIDQPHVSHFRLALHLSLALIIFSLIFWNLLSCTGAAQIKTNALIKFLTIATILLLFVQIIFGAFVAGLKAGHIYNSFPLMNGDLIPPEVTLQDLTNLSNPVIVQFYHRMLALLSFSLITLLAYNVYKNFRHSILFYRSVLLVVVCIFQILLGIITLLNNVPVDYALIHQLGAFVVFAVAIALLHPMIGNSQTCRGIK